MFSEICAGIDGRNTVQQHILQHIDDFIAINVDIRADGELVDLGGRPKQPRRDGAGSWTNTLSFCCWMGSGIR